jgi:uncharacterized BrkB/YihY/UPF0761 family membrane protein
MEFLKLTMGWIVALFMAVVGLIILLQMTFGKINLKNLISEENGDASMSRFQLLIFTFVISMSLFMVIVSKTPLGFPDHIPTEILTLLGISGGSYLVSKGIQSSKETSKAAIQAQQAPGNAVGAPPAANGPGIDQAMG